MLSTSASTWSGPASHDTARMSHSLGPRCPKSARKPSRASANRTTDASAAAGSASATAATPWSNSALTSGDALASRDSRHKPHDGDADGTSPKPEIRSSRAAGSPAPAQASASIAGPTAEPNVE